MNKEIKELIKINKEGRCRREDSCRGCCFLEGFVCHLIGTIPVINMPEFGYNKEKILKEARMRLKIIKLKKI
jgi:hypothetical protein